MRHRWNLFESMPDPVEFARACGLGSPVAAQCLWNRGCRDSTSAERFLEPRLRDLTDPFLLPDMGQAVDRLMQARAAEERVVIFGDYDVDGVTSAALLSEALRGLGWGADVYLPHRVEEGYGLSRDGVANCLKQYPATLLIAVDCGTTSIATIDELREAGVDVLIVDHHQQAGQRPNALALVNPWGGSSFSENSPSTELCSVGLVFKLVHALVKRCREAGIEGAGTCDLRVFLDMVALGTVSDLVPLIRENRILVTAGLKRLSSTLRLGLQALKGVARMQGAVSAQEVGFQLGPRLNAAGRLESANLALALLQTTDSKEAQRLAGLLDSQNQARQELERGIIEPLLEDLKARFDPDRDHVIVEGSDGWHPGVLGIVASRIMRAFHRPTLILGGGDQEWKGSGRSIVGFDMAAAFRKCDSLLVKHGGHSMAAGVTLRSENLVALREALNDLARRSISAAQRIPELRLDAVTDLGKVDWALLEELNRLAPFGMGNPQVQLLVPSVRVEGSVMHIGKNGRHLKCKVRDDFGCHELIWWNADSESFPESEFDLAFVPSVSEFQGRRWLQLKFLDWRPCAGES